MVTSYQRNKYMWHYLNNGVCYWQPQPRNMVHKSREIHVTESEKYISIIREIHMKGIVSAGQSACSAETFSRPDPSPRLVHPCHRLHICTSVSSLIIYFVCNFLAFPVFVCFRFFWRVAFFPKSFACCIFCQFLSYCIKEAKKTRKAERKALFFWMSHFFAFCICCILHFLPMSHKSEEEEKGKHYVQVRPRWTI